ncbi:glycosyltransferase family 2 protein [Marinicaulis aureus]|uniref:Glycosyltransferase family 2 protein n=1 Tax=Hyphococcus aureus TaxID=2666033 RepID=A0ABW1KV64_9PROT
MKTAVIIASLGRAAELEQLTPHLVAQTEPAHRIVYSVTERADLPPETLLPANAEVMFGEKGLPKQRNRGLERVMSDCDIVVFIDDDYLPSRYMLEGVRRFFIAHPDCAGATGYLLADGINSEGVSYDEATALIEEADANPTLDDAVKRDLNGLYGCNMAYRAEMIGDTRFDECLPLYGWQEDIDFAASLLPKGRLAKTHAFWGVHRGVKGARTSGVKLGYSQVANPFYLMRKGTMSAKYGWKLIAKNVAANHYKMFTPEPWVDRAGRCHGNWLALWELLTGRSDPQRILTLRR